MCVKEMAAVLFVEPSPKSHKTLVIVPVELFVKLTVSGITPLVGPAVKRANGTIAPTPANGLVLLPSLLVVKTITLLKLAALVGAKRTSTLVEPKPIRLNGVPERIEKGPPLTEAVPLLKAAKPRLVT